MSDFSTTLDNETVRAALDHLEGFVDQMREEKIYTLDVEDSIRDMVNALDRLGVEVS